MNDLSNMEQVLNWETKKKPRPFSIYTNQALKGVRPLVANQCYRSLQHY